MDARDGLGIADLGWRLSRNTPMTRQVLIELDDLEQLLTAARSSVSLLFEDLKNYSSDSSEDRDHRTQIYASISRINLLIQNMEKKTLFS